MSVNRPFNVSAPIVDADGVMDTAFVFQLNKLFDKLPIVGAGTPEDVVAAPQYSVYINSTGSSGTLMYVKKLEDIGGDLTKGWIAV